MHAENAGLPISAGLPRSDRPGQSQKPCAQKQPAVTICGLLTSLLLCPCLGCHSNFVEATVINATSRPIRLLEVDYPSASFGTQDLAPGTSFHYRFKILGEGSAKLIWTDEQEKEHTMQGPAMHEGQEGLLRIRIEPTTTDWHLDLHSR